MDQTTLDSPHSPTEAFEQQRRRYSENAYLRGNKAEARNRKIFAAHKAGKRVREIARKFQLSQTKIRDVLKKMLDAEFKHVMAPQLIEEHIAAGTPAQIPLSVLIGERRYHDWHWAARCLGGDPPISEVKAYYEDFTREQVNAYIRDFDEHIAAIEHCLGPVAFMSVEQFHARALARIDFYRSQNRWHMMRYIDWDPRPESFFAKTLPSRSYTTGQYHRTTNSSFDPEMTLAMAASGMGTGFYNTCIYYDDQVRAEHEYVALECLVRRHGGPGNFTKFVKRARENWRDRIKDEEQEPVQESAAPHEKAVAWAKQDISMHRNCAIFIAAISVFPVMLANYEARMLRRPDILVIAHNMHIGLGRFQFSFLLGAVCTAFVLWLVYLELRNWWNACQKLKRAKAALAEFARNRVVGANALGP
jgi:hypothetical protein